MWLLIALSCGIGLVILQMIFAYNYLLIKDRDALRSESYTLNKLAIEKGLIGDSDAGVVNVEAKNVSGQQLLGQQIIQDDPK